MLIGVVGQKKRSTSINSNTNYRREIKLAPINMDSSIPCFKILLRLRLLGRFLTNFNFFNVNPEIRQSNRKCLRSNCLDTELQSISDISLKVIKRENSNYNASFLRRTFFSLMH